MEWRSVLARILSTAIPKGLQCPYGISESKNATSWALAGMCEVLRLVEEKGFPFDRVLI